MVLDPILKNSIKHFEKQTGNFEEAKLAAAKEFLQFYLNYDEEELTELDIQSTQLAKDDLLYIVIPEQSNIRELYGRIAQSQNRDINTRNFIPPQFYSRFMFISKCCRDLRDANSDLKTQMRFGKSDIEVLTKIRGSDEPYKIVSIKQICKDAGNVEKIPDFDDKLKWHKRNDKIPHRPLTSNVVQGKPPSAWLEGESLPIRHHLSRTSSQNDAPKKRFRNSEDTDEKMVDVDDEC